jgi:hypothetical protein
MVKSSEKNLNSIFKCGWPWVFHYNSVGKLTAVFKAKLPQKQMEDYYKK